MEKKRFKRSQFAVVLVLAPLNNTFERKCLVVPFAPEVLKLGRQTTARTAAASDNGYFDSRVLSRQHAEIWAERETGQVWLRDCKSSNGTYINKQRLSPENTESEPFELKRNDELYLGIDIVSNDDPKQMYHRISARVEKVSMLLLQMNNNEQVNGLGALGAGSSIPNGTTNGQATNGLPNTSNGAANGLRHLQIPASNQISPSPSPSVSRKPSLETLKNVSTHSSGLDGRSSEAIFGANTSLESMALNYANTTAGGMLVKDSVKSHVEFELAAKRLVAQIRAVRADTAKLESLSALLTEIKEAALETEKRDIQERENLEKERQQFEAERKARQAEDASRHGKMKSSSMAALKAENARYRAEIANYTKSSRGARSRALSFQSSADSSSHNQGRLHPVISDSRSETSKSDGPSKLDASPRSEISARTDPRSSSHSTSHSHSHSHSPKEWQPSTLNARHNAIVLVGTALLVTIVGVLIMFFFNPPMAPSSHSPPFFEFILPQR